MSVLLAVTQLSYRLKNIFAGNQLFLLATSYFCSNLRFKQASLGSS